MGGNIAEEWEYNFVFMAATSGEERTSSALCDAKRRAAMGGVFETARAPSAELSAPRATR
jgi:hypothetical protein